MTSTPGKSPNSSGNRQPKKHLSSRISSLLTGKTNHINDQSIELNEPLRLYGPGETVKGKLVLDVAKPLGITHIVLCLYGYAQVFKNYNSPRAGIRNSSGRVVTGRDKRWVTEYHGDGFATLFEKEVVLCGEGRLDPKLYHFQFEIDFPKDVALPTSIDFERGTVSYLVIATVTRPTPINPTSSIEHKVAFRQYIDVASLSDPKPRVVTLEPLRDATKSKSSLRRLASYDGSRRSQMSARSKTDRSRKTTNSNSNSSRAEDASPGPVSPSIKSSRSNSTCDQSMGTSNVGAESGSNLSNQSTREADTEDGKIIASVQLSRTGFLPGETVTVKVQIQHAKVVQAVDAILVTLYRQARVDMHPVVPGQKKSEDYYPRSKTGLGGLSLSTAGSSQTWRKDLSQTTAPLYIDPRTLSAEVKVAVAVPDGAFPSIRNVPGDMISFTYYVEVIIDIHGKVSNSHSNFPNLDITAPQKSYGRADMLKKPGELNSSSPMLYGTNCIDTTQKRRDKHTITVQCDLIVGTNDSERASGKRRAADAADKDRTLANDSSHMPLPQNHINGTGAHHDDMHESPTRGDRIQANVEQWRNNNWHQQRDYNHAQDDYGYADEFNYNYDGEYAYGYDYGHGYGYDEEFEVAYYPNGVPRDAHGSITASHPPYIPPPHLLEEEGQMESQNLTEKEQLRRAEARLLPSAPPIDDHEQATGASSMPSAPFLPNEHDYFSNAAYREAVARQHENLDPTYNGEMPRLGRFATSTSTIRPPSETDVDESDNGDGDGAAAGVGEAGEAVAATGRTARSPEEQPVKSNATSATPCVNNRSLPVRSREEQRAVDESSQLRRPPRSVGPAKPGMSPGKAKTQEPMSSSASPPEEQEIEEDEDEDDDDDDDGDDDEEEEEDGEEEEEAVEGDSVYAHHVDTGRASGRRREGRRDMLERQPEDLPKYER